MANPWITSINTYWFYSGAAPAYQDMGLQFGVTDLDTGSQGSLSIDYPFDPTLAGDATVGSVTGDDASFQIYLFTNSFEFIQQVLWALALPNNIALSCYTGGSPSATTGGYPYTVDTFTLGPGAFSIPLPAAEPALVAAEVALPEITAEMPEKLRKALERRCEHQVHLREAGLRLTLKR